MRAFTHELLDAVAPKGRMDVVRDLAYPLPANVIAELLGMPTADREQLQAWSRDIVPIFSNGDVPQLRQAQRSMLEMHDYLRAIAAERRRAPREDVLSMFVAAEAEGTVTEDEAVANCVLLLFAGHETTANLIANGLVLLFENPDQLARLRADPALTPLAVEEMLRCPRRRSRRCCAAPAPPASSAASPRCPSSWPGIPCPPAGTSTWR